MDKEFVLRHVAHGVGDAVDAEARLAASTEGHPVSAKGRRAEADNLLMAVYDRLDAGALKRFEPIEVLDWIGRMGESAACNAGSMADIDLLKGLLRRSGNAGRGCWKPYRQQDEGRAKPG